MSSTQQLAQSVTKKQSNTSFVIENGIITGVEKFHAINHENIGELVLEFLNRRSEHIAQIDAMTERKITCKELKDRGIRLAIWMTKEGIKTGDVISLSSPMHLDDIIIILASLLVGATYAPFRQDLSMRSARNNINHLKPRIVFTCKNSMDLLQEAAQIENHVWKMIVLDAELSHPSLNYILGLQTNEEVFQFRMKSKIDPSTVCLLSSTSGTTGAPKFVCHTYKAIKIWISAFCNLDQAQVSNEVTLSYLYPGWSINFIYGLKYLLDGCTQVFHAEFDPHETCKIIEKYKVNTLVTTTYWISLLSQDDTLNKYDLESVSLLFPMGSKLYSAVEQKLRKRFRNAAIEKGLGANEVLDLTTTLTECLNPESVGIVLPNVQLKIVDVKSGSTLGPGQVGEICAKTPYAMIGYYENPVMTKLVYDDDGWYHSGDQGYYEENGEIVVLGRSKEMIRFRHDDIYPSLVEKILLSHPSVADAAVVGIQHEVEMELPVAFVKVAQDSSVTEEDILELMCGLQGYCDAFKDSIFFIDEVPRSPNGKIQKNILRERAEKMYAQRQEHL